MVRDGNVRCVSPLSLVTLADQVRAVSIALVASAICLAWIGRPSFWYDEAATIAAAERPISQLFHLVEHRDLVHTPYYLSMHAWVGIFGTGEVALRIPSAVGIAISVYLIYRLGFRLAGARTATFSAIAAAVLPGLSLAGTEARSVSWTVALAALATIRLLGALETGRTRDWVWYTVATSAAIYVFVYCCFLLACHLITVFAVKRLSRSWLVAALAICVLSSPWLILATGQREQIAWINAPVAKMARRAAIDQYFLGTRPGASDQLALTGALVTLGIAVGLVLRVAAAARRHTTDRVLLAVALPLAVVPALMLLLISATGTPTYAERYALYGVPGLAILMGRGIELAARSWGWIAAPAVLALIAGSSAPALALQKVVDAKWHENYRAAAAFVGPDGPGVEVVLYARADAMGVRTAYPEAFRDVDQPNVRSAGPASGTLFGEILPPRQTDPADVTGKTVALIRKRSEGTPFTGWLLRLGCSSTYLFGDSRHWVVVYRC